LKGLRGHHSRLLLLRDICPLLMLFCCSTVVTEL